MLKKYTIDIPMHQFFNSDILSRPVPKLRDWSGTLEKIYKMIKKKIEKRTLKMPEKNKRFQDYEKEFLKLYEQITKKEKELEGQTNHITQGFGYSFPNIDRGQQKVFESIKFPGRTRVVSHKFKRYSKTKKV